MTNTVNFTNRLYALLTVEKNGKGSVTPDYNGKYLEIGKSWKMTATGAPGWVFTSWTGSLVTNHPTLSFVMQSNLAFTANFGDVQSPIIKFLSPSNGARITNNWVTIRGQISDNGSLREAAYRRMDGDWEPLGTPANWEADVALEPGTNLFEIRAVDTAGNAASGRLSLFRVLASELVVQFEGKGTLMPNYNGKVLEIGRSYSMTVTPAAGFVFTNWTDIEGRVLTNSRTLKFTMQPDLVLQANLKDIQRPSLSVASPLDNARISNDVAVVRGKVADNDNVDAIFCRVNGGSWTDIPVASNWMSEISLDAGTNRFDVYAVDLTGNVSLTSKLSYFRVVGAPLTVNLIGKGLLTPNYSGRHLEIGRGYSMTATAGAGFVFRNWTDPDGNELTKSPTIRFVMQPELALQANFFDVQKPVFSITSPVEGARIMTEQVMLRGKVADNGSVSNVFCRLNGGEWLSAEGTNSWQLEVDLAPGTNVVEAYAVDLTGNASSIVRRSCFRVVPMPLVVRTWGKGTLTPNYGGKSLEIGRTYTMVASGEGGFAFADWKVSTAWVGAVSTAAKQLTFTMRTNLTIEANFVLPNRPAVKARTIDLGPAGVYDLYMVAKGSTPISAVPAPLTYGILSNTAYLYLAPTATGVPITRNMALLSGLTGPLSQFLLPPSSAAQFSRVRYEKNGDVFFASWGEWPGVLEGAFLYGYSREDRQALYYRFMLEGLAFKNTPVDQTCTAIKPSPGSTNKVYVERLHPRIAGQICADLAMLLKKIGQNPHYQSLSSAWSGAADIGQFGEESDVVKWLLNLPDTDPLGTDSYLSAFQFLRRIQDSHPELVNGLSSLARCGDFAMYLGSQISDAHEHALVEIVLRSYLNSSEDARARVALLRAAYNYTKANYEIALDPALDDAIAQLESSVMEQDNELQATIAAFLNSPNRWTAALELMVKVDALSKGKVVSLAGKFGQLMISSVNKNAGNVFYKKFSSAMGAGGAEFVTAMIASLRLVNDELNFYKEHASLLTILEIIHRHEIGELLPALQAPTLNLDTYGSYRASQMLRLYFANRICERVLDEKVTFGDVNWTATGIDAAVGLLKAPRTAGFSAVGPFIDGGNSLMKSIASYVMADQWKALETERRLFRTNLVSYYYAAEVLPVCPTNGSGF